MRGTRTARRWPLQAVGALCASWRGESPVTGIVARDSNEPGSVILGGESNLNCTLELGLGLGFTTMASATNLGNQKCTPAPTAMPCAPSKSLIHDDDISYPAPSELLEEGGKGGKEMKRERSCGLSLRAPNGALIVRKRRAQRRLVLVLWVWVQYSSASADRDLLISGTCFIVIGSEDSHCQNLTSGMERENYDSVFCSFQQA